ENVEKHRENFGEKFVEFGEKFGVSKGTHVLVPLGGSSPTGWEAELDEGVAEPLVGVAGSDVVWVGLRAPPTAPIGRYRLSVRTRTESGEFAAPFDGDNDVVLLFNPWCPEDSVYMEKTGELSEYVLNESGRIFYGTEEQIAERSWNYGQVRAPKSREFSPKKIPEGKEPETTQKSGILTRKLG
ncbi:PREDICTED: protein-glutamine gamma-glutamyltransferase K-like, partial [Pseudopodoces humilis]|uniref:protein-glutamine gamma-glutamyltransferase K-like n=1 Tax=Pseudopodoces humilis TaxID=181119 RepID=UPI0006B81222